MPKLVNFYSVSQGVMVIILMEERNWDVWYGFNLFLGFSAFQIKNNLLSNNVFK